MAFAFAQKESKICSVRVFFYNIVRITVGIFKNKTKINDPVYQDSNETLEQSFVVFLFTIFLTTVLFTFLLCIKMVCHRHKDLLQASPAPVNVSLFPPEHHCTRSIYPIRLSSDHSYVLHS